MTTRKFLPVVLMATLSVLTVTPIYGNEKSATKSESMGAECGDTKMEAKQIEQLLKTYFAALNKADLKAAVASYAKDGIFMPNNKPSAVGADQIKDAYTLVFNTLKFNVGFKIEEVITGGDYAYAITSSNGEITLLDKGITVPNNSRELFVVKKVSGEWKIARYMFNESSRSP